MAGDKAAGEGADDDGCVLVVGVLVDWRREADVKDECRISN